MDRNHHHSSPRLTIWIALGLAVAISFTLFASWPALSGPFLFDDYPNLEQLAFLNGRTDWASLANFAAQYRSQPGRPLAMLSFVINDSAWPSSPWSFKYTNLMLHALVGVLVFGFARHLARLHLHENRSSLAALIVAAAWLIHPMQLSTSMLVVQRMTQLSALFALAGLWAFLVLAHRAASSASSLLAVVVLGIGTILATLCKETGALTPLLAHIILQTLMRERLQALPRKSARILCWGTALPVALLAAAIALRWEAATVYDSRPFTMGERLLTEFRVLCDYLYHIVVPSLRGGGIYHDDYVVSRSLLDPWTTIPALAFVFSALAFGIFGRRRWPVFSFAVLWYFAGHLLESTVFPLELYFEHRNYLPMVGPLFAFGYMAASTPLFWQRYALTGSLVWILFAAWLLHVQAPIWGNRDALVSIWAIEHPQSPRATQEYAAYLYRHGRASEASELLIEAYKRGVHGSDFPVQVLLLACMTNDKKMAEKVGQYLDASLETGEYNRATPITLRKLRVQVQRRKCPSIVSSDDWLNLTKKVLSNPRYSHGDTAAYIHIERAYLFEHRRQLNPTMLELEAAWEAQSTPELAQLISATLLSAGLYDPAEQWAHRALEFQIGGLRGLFSNDEENSRQLIEVIQAARLKEKELNQ